MNEIDQNINQNTPLNNEVNKEDLNTKVFLSRISKIVLIPVVLFLLIAIYFVSAPFSSFNKPLMLEIDSGDSLKTISNEILAKYCCA